MPESARPDSSPTVSVVIPTLNEAENLPYVFPRLPDDAEIVVVDGRSSDGTVDVARSLRPDAVIVHQTRSGKGNAVACGCAAATGDIIVMLDADGSADPAEIPQFMRALTAGADFARGSRFLPLAGSNDITPLRRMGNRCLNALANALVHARFTDLCYGYNAFWRRCIPVFDLDPDGCDQKLCWGDGFEVETLINIRTARAGLRVVEVPSFEYRRLHGTSKLNPISDGLRVLFVIVKEWGRSGSWRPRSEMLPAVALWIGPEQSTRVDGSTFEASRKGHHHTTRRGVSRYRRVCADRAWKIRSAGQCEVIGQLPQ
ncbi:glycosyltransferase family 2 protein [Frankia sp. CiP3]|uniref:glycosyltransferase family 2 protein n=1 Tax=Frankia sp. CiP3 TaxID=2880971 RepID=UPI001EF52381|nr:glycosyltransferase family 2 protein [Frankia sp. CiP3]